MCLYIKDTTRQDEAGNYVLSIAKKDIICWKRLMKTKSGYVTTYQEYPVNIGSRGTRMKANLGIYGHQVHQGIHAFYIKKAAIDTCHNDEVVVQCIIPAGAKYLKGKYDEIVATEMKIGKIVYKPKNS